MFLAELRVENLRNIDALQLSFAPGLNLFTGPNGAGKTSILEAAYLLSRAQSFRTRQVDTLIRLTNAEFSVFGLIETSGGQQRLGLVRRTGRWTARLDGKTPTNLSQLLAVCAVTCFEPGSHALISGSAELRRSFLDWGVFHVEPEYASLMRRYRRVLRQRNAALKQRADAVTLDTWDEQLATTGTIVAQQRARYVEDLQLLLNRTLKSLLPELGATKLDFFQGWDSMRSLADSLIQSREADRRLGFTSNGPHRADWNLAFELAPLHAHLSRGQEKLCAIACLLAQAERFQQARGDWPIFALDDLCSELDASHQAAVMNLLKAMPGQILLTGTEMTPDFLRAHPPQCRFHVEQGQVRKML